MASGVPPPTRSFMLGSRWHVATAWSSGLGEVSGVAVVDGFGVVFVVFSAILLGGKVAPRLRL